MSQFRFDVIKFFELVVHLNWSSIGDVCFADGHYAFDYGVLAIVTFGIHFTRREIDAYAFKEDSFRSRVQMMLNKHIDDFHDD